MTTPRIILFTAVLIAGMIFLAGTPVSAQGIQASMGEDVKIAGYSTAGPYVYLFLTGPNLPANGVALNDITKRADQGGFTRVSVDGNDYWSYTWHTNSINGRLDDGVYTIWVVNGPNDRSNLAMVDYRTISVTLGKPSISVNIPAQPGGMELRSEPDGASITVNGVYRGKTPLELGNFDPGTYDVTFSLPGFADMSVRVPVEQGKTAEVKATLVLEAGTLVVNTSPSGARVLLDGTPSGFSPVTLANISAGTHTIVLEKEGFVASSISVSIVPGQATPVDVTLEPVPVTATPATTRSAGLGTALAGAFCVIVLGISFSGRRDR